MNPIIYLRRSCVLAAFVTLFAAFGTVQAADIQAGAEKSQICAACHGADGKSPIDPSYAILAGQNEDYLAAALRAYKRGSRKNGTMNGQAKTLSNNDINNLAAYYASLPGPLTTRR